MAAEISFENLKKEYQNFANPVAHVEVEGKVINQAKTKLSIGEIEIDVTSGYEAGIASFVVYGCYNRLTCSFEYDKIKKYVMIGAQVSISLGYGSVVKEVFCGFISQVNFFFQEDEIPGVRVTCMDIKGMMMSSCYSKQMTSTCYSDAVSSIFSQLRYTQMQDRGVIKRVSITDTPDKMGLEGIAGGSAAGDFGGALAGGIPGAATPSVGMVTDKSVEMVAESDYEFVVKAAKKFNYEFFVSGGVVYFRKAKNYASVLMELSPATGMRNIDVEYDVTGLVGEIEVRSTDVGKAQQISSSVKLNNKISKGKYAKNLVKNSAKVYIDPTADSKLDAGYRADYLAEDIAYRFGTLEAEIIGIPDIVVGRFIKLIGMGDPVNNLFYVVSVRHVMNGNRGFSTTITAKAAGLGGSYSAGGSGIGGMFGGTVAAVAGNAGAAADALGDVADGLGSVGGLLNGII
ncbi:MAG: phage late control D family protein [Eubacterium sp.]|nr:phage late control D family protein [Eubacterium sp.]